MKNTNALRRLSFALAKDSMQSIEKAAKEKHLRVERITAKRFEEARRLRIKFRDKPRIPFTDFAPMVVMAESGIAEVLTEDEHFRSSGLAGQATVSRA